MSKQVPKGWEVGVFGDLARVQNGYAFKSSDFSDVGDATVIRMSNLKLGRVDLSDAKYVSKQSISGLGQFRLSDGDFLFGMSGSLDNYAWLKNTDGVCYLNQRVGRLRVKSQVDPLYASYCYLSDMVKNAIIGLAAGAAQLNISGSQLEAISILIPPLPEQQKIATILTSVDTVIEKTRAQIDKLKHLKTAMMQELLTKGIGHTEFKDSPVGKIPVEWEYGLLEDIAVIQTGVAKNSKATGDLIEVPYLRVANVQDGYLDLNEIKTLQLDKSRLGRFMLRDEDVLVNEGGDFDKLGRGAIWRNQVSPCVHQNHVFVVRTNQKKLLPMFFNYLSGSQHGKQYYLGCAKQTTNLASLNSSQLKQFPVLIPSIEEQERICEVLNSIDTKIETIEQKLSATEKAKKALMQDLLTGIVRV